MRDNIEQLIEMFLAAGYDDSKAGISAFERFSPIKFFEAYRATRAEREQADHLTDAQLAAGVEALRSIRKKFNGNETDGAIVYAVYFAVKEATRS